MSKSNQFLSLLEQLFELKDNKEFNLKSYVNLFKSDNSFRINLEKIKNKIYIPNDIYLNHDIVEISFSVEKEFELFISLIKFLEDDFLKKTIKDKNQFKKNLFLHFLVLLIFKSKEVKDLVFNIERITFLHSKTPEVKENIDIKHSYIYKYVKKDLDVVIKNLKQKKLKSFLDVYLNGYDKEKIIIEEFSKIDLTPNLYTLIFFRILSILYRHHQGFFIYLITDEYNEELEQKERDVTLYKNLYTQYLEDEDEKVKLSTPIEDDFVEEEY